MVEAVKILVITRFYGVCIKNDVYPSLMLNW